MSRPICAVVGGGEGLGQALAGKFSSKGFDIALVSRSQKGSDAAAKAASEACAKANVKFFSADVTEPQSVERAFSDIADDMGAVDVLLYSVRGEFTACEPLEMTYAALEEIYRLEVVGAFAAAKSVLPSMRMRGQGSVFFSSATAAFRGSKSHPLYAIGKFGLRAVIAKSFQSLFHGRRAYRACQTGLRSRCSNYARILRRELRSREIGRSRRCGRSLLAHSSATKICLEQ